MIYNGMHFVDIPLPNFISEYRSKRNSFDSVEAAASDFLGYLRACGEASDQDLSKRSVLQIVDPVLDSILSRIHEKVLSAVAKPTGQVTSAMLQEIVAQQVEVFHKVYSEFPDADFIGPKPRFTKARIGILTGAVERYFPSEPLKVKKRLVDICKYALLKRASAHYTGIVIAGFGVDDIFPTLCGFRVDGMVFGSLKYQKTEHIDIDRKGDRARVLPFAQKEMVERFLYGLEAPIERQIQKFCQNTVSQIALDILNEANITGDARDRLLQRAHSSEQEFLKGLRDDAFNVIRRNSQTDIEDMVEFMPKPELAIMAEALVNLTSLKRKVSKGMETVGGPVDVAVISRSEGFIWVKRKHYFEANLNPRYAARVRVQARQSGEEYDG